MFTLEKVLLGRKEKAQRWKKEKRAKSHMAQVLAEVLTERSEGVLKIKGAGGQLGS